MSRTRQTAVRRTPSGRQHHADHGRADLGHIAAHSLHAGIAVLDSEGVVRWNNEAWSADTTLTAMGDANVGSNFLELVAVGAGPHPAAMSRGIMAVLAGVMSYVELQSVAETGQRVKLVITRLRGGRGGVVLHLEPIAGRAAATGASRTIDAARITERLTPRELDVLTRMATGLSNRVIAQDLGIEYTTVRGYVQSVLTKLGARSRVDAVARAYRSGLVRETRV